MVAGAARDQLRLVLNRPICLVDHAEEVFAAGTPDPFMLFEHRMRPGWAGRVATVVHLDGTARLQALDAHSDLVVRRCGALTWSRHSRYSSEM